MRESTVGDRGPAPDARELHAALDGRWQDVLPALGIGAEYLSNRHGPCPVCGEGHDRFRFDDEDGRGTWICTHCGAGDGLALIQRVHGWPFPRVCREVAEVAGVMPGATSRRRQPMPEARSARSPARRSPATPSARVKALRRSAARPADVADVVEYLVSRNVWPLPKGCPLRGHASADYWDDGTLIGRYPALIADVHDVDGELVTAHVTYLDNGSKLESYSPRKILSPLTGRRGCAVRLMPLDGDTLGIAEGIETALAAAQIHGVPTWAALSAPMLAKFLPPPGVHRVMIFADADRAGLEAAWRLREELDGRATCELCVPPAPHKDWNDALRARGKS